MVRVNDNNIEFWCNKYYRLPRKLIFNHQFWTHSNNARNILLLKGVRCSGIKNRNSCFLGYREISSTLRIPLNKVGDYVWELIDHDFPLIIPFQKNNGSRPYNYKLHPNAIIYKRNEPFFPFYGILFYENNWLELSHQAQDLYLIAGGVSFQLPDKNMYASLNNPLVKIANKKDIEAGVDVYESVKNFEDDKYEFLDLDKIYKELEKNKLLKDCGKVVKIPLLDPDQIIW